jgi:hypothetical protein
MKSSWQTETGHLTCRWAACNKDRPSTPTWMEVVSNVKGSYLPPLPDFPSHGPMGGASWFELHCKSRESAQTS